METTRRQPGMNSGKCTLDAFLPRLLHTPIKKPGHAEEPAPSQPPSKALTASPARDSSLDVSITKLPAFPVGSSSSDGAMDIEAFAKTWVIDESALSVLRSLPVDDQEPLVRDGESKKSNTNEQRTAWMRTLRKKRNKKTVPQTYPIGEQAGMSSTTQCQQFCPSSPS